MIDNFTGFMNLRNKPEEFRNRVFEVWREMEQLKYSLYYVDKYCKENNLSDNEEFNKLKTHMVEEHKQLKAKLNELFNYGEMFYK